MSVYATLRRYRYVYEVHLLAYYYIKPGGRVAIYESSMKSCIRGIQYIYTTFQVLKQIKVTNFSQTRATVTSQCVHRFEGIDTPIEYIVYLIIMLIRLNSVH